MPRAPDGSYNLPPGTIVSSGDTIEPSQHNPAMQDIAQALGNSLDRNGSGGMRAPLDMGGFTVQNAGSASADTDLATLSQVTTAGVPIGSIMDFAGAFAPVGYLLCYGQAVSRIDYADLFAVIGTIHGSGNGTTTFNVPDLRGRVSAGKDDMGGTPANRLTSTIAPNGQWLGGAGGAETHTLTTGQMPTHNHGVNDPGHSHTFRDTFGGVGVGMELGDNFVQATSSTGASFTGISIQNAGSGEAHNNVQPTIIVNKIIKARAV